MKKNYPTPHINATPDDIAKTVLMPGDPLRARFVAENFMENAVLFNNVRGVSGYTGSYNGKKVSVMASGMGMPSMGIYSYELFNFFDVDNIIRIGSAGSINDNVKVRDIVLGMGACTNSSYAEQYHLAGTYAPIASFSLLRRAADMAEKLKLSYHVGNLLSSDTFYNEFSEDTLDWSKMNVLAVEMEAAALYMNAARSGKNALAICTVSDSLLTGESLPALERQTSFTDMMKLALEVATGDI
ncbi:MAG: purine-nucleoside phosphorylase [Ruminococcaceae bacterium]|nr:purine-nucleoside phosphorylase [Oscillospiraceae bacterium]